MKSLRGSAGVILTKIMCIILAENTFVDLAHSASPGWGFRIFDTTNKMKEKIAQSVHVRDNNDTVGYDNIFA
jgi:hypothetical protein